MFKFNNFKILLLLMLFAFAVKNAWAGDPDYWMYIHLNQKCEPTGSGKVYASTNPLSADNPSNCVTVSNEGKEYVTSTHESNINNKNWVSGTQWFVNTIPIDVWSYGFVGWKNGDGQIVSTEPSPLQSFYDPGVYAAKNSDGTGGKTEDKPYYQPNPFPFSLELTAVYEEIDPIVVAVPENYSIGNTIISKANNEVGDTIEIFAYPILPSSKFIGWYKDGILESTKNPYSFTIEDETRHTYTAKFRTGYSFYRVINKHTGRIINGIKDQGDISDLSALQLVDYETAQVSAGSVFEIKYHNSGYPESVDFIVQNFDPGSKYYDYKNGIYMCMRHKIIDNTWKIHPNRSTPFMADKGSGDVVVGENITNNYNSQEYVDWFLEPFDLDLETKENYFSLDPNKLVEVDGKYYTTLRTSWNILFNPEQMTPYIVKSVNETEGTFEMEPITGNIIPAGTPVIIETNSNDVEENRMVPTLTNAANGAVPSGNQLVSSVKYFPNQPAPVSNCKGLYKNANGQLAFGDALNTVNGNEAYLSVANEVVHDVQPVLTETTLAYLLEYGEIGPNYKITDLTCVYIQGNTLYCKDDNHALNKSVKNEGDVDYIKTYTAFQNGDWDQSNWIAINLPEGSSVTTDYMEAVIDHRLNNVVGRLKSKINPEFEATLMPSGGDENPYNENTYITCNFSGVHQHGVVNGEEVNLFFVAPKPMEIAQVEWAMYHESGMFVIPSTADDSGLEGAFLPNFSMLENVEDPDPQPGYGYHFPALIKLTETSSQSSAPILAAGNSSTWTVYPLEWNTDTPTAIDNMQTGKTVTRVVYYNLMGVESDVPHPGINIVEKRYSDGSRSVEKVMK